MMFEIGRVCIKLAGRDAGKSCVVVDIVDDTYVMIDGQTRRRKCNVNHLEPTKKTFDISKGADSQTVYALFEKEGKVIPKKGSAKKASERPKKAHVVKTKKTTKAKK